ncbi:MAG: DUF2914 domain-containing protein [bacterium]|nr:DUF2914 domain-containing protein [bacterium]
MDSIIEKIRRMYEKYSLREATRLFEKNEKYLSPATLITGFIIDALTLVRVDLWLDNVILLSYLALAGVAMAFINLETAGRIQNIRARKLILWFPLVLQFAFGGLFSGFVVLYSRSASLAASWPFILMLAFLLVGNEFFRNRYHRLTFQLGIYFVAFLSYLTFAVPVLLDKIGPEIFLLSTFLALVIILLIILLFKKITPEIFQANKKSIAWLILSILVIFNFLYFADIIPPLPLALKELIIAHNIEISGDGYYISYEPAKWYHIFRSYNPVYHMSAGETVYAFSLIYAPANLKTTVVHEWTKYDESSRRWTVVNNLPFSVSGGREQGFRGYSYKTRVSAGKWRVTTKTSNGQTLGRTKFEIEETDTRPKVVTEKK